MKSSPRNPSFVLIEGEASSVFSRSGLCRRRHSYTKINRCLAEGRQRFRDLVARSEDGRRCQEMESLLSAFCDGEIEPQDSAALRGHLSACASCRATLRAYRAAGPAAAALGPALPLSRTLAERAQELFAGLQARLPGGSGATEITMTQIASGGRGTGVATIAKVLAICVGTAGGATCVATGVVPFPLAAERPEKVSSERRAAPPAVAETEPEAGAGTYADAPAPPSEEAAGDQPRERRARRSEDRAGTGPGSTTAKRSSPPPPPATEFTPEIAAPPPEYGGTEAGGGGSDGGVRDGPAGPGPAATNRANAAEVGP